MSIRLIRLILKFVDFARGIIFFQKKGKLIEQSILFCALLSYFVRQQFKKGIFKI